MHDMRRFSELHREGRMTWSEGARAWVAEPADVVRALADDGFQEYKHEITRSRRDRAPTGGMWQGLKTENGSVASAIWIQRTGGEQAIVFVDIDGERIGGAPGREEGRV